MPNVDAVKIVLVLIAIVLVGGFVASIVSQVQSLGAQDETFSEFMDGRVSAGVGGEVVPNLGAGRFLSFAMNGLLGDTWPLVKIAVSSVLLLLIVAFIVIQIWKLLT